MTTSVRHGNPARSTGAAGEVQAVPGKARPNPIRITFEVDTPTTIERHEFKLADVALFGTRAVTFPEDALVKNSPFVGHGTKYVLTMKDGRKLQAMGPILVATGNAAKPFAGFPDVADVHGKSGAQVQKEMRAAARR